MAKETVKDQEKYFVGRRKNAVAVVRIIAGSGNIFVNGRPLKDYFKVEGNVVKVYVPFQKCDVVDKYDIVATAKGGGITGQAEALRHAISKALASLDPVHRKLLKKEGLLYRDPRVVERKKPGRPKARKRFQYSKR